MSAMKEKVRIASCSIIPTKWEKDANYQKMCDFLRRAAAQGAEVAVTPEGCLEGYVPIVAIEEGRGPEMMAVAEPLDGPYFRGFQDLARELHMAMVICFAERRGGEAYNAAAWIEADGQVAGVHRKTHLNEGYDPAWSFDRPGDQIAAIDTQLGRMGIMICYERRVPEVARCLMLDGAQLLINPSLGHYKTWNDAVVAARAHENMLPLVFCHARQSLFFDNQGNLMVEGGEEAITMGEVTLGTPAWDDNLLRRLRRPSTFRRILEP